MFDKKFQRLTLQQVGGLIAEKESELTMEQRRNMLVAWRQMSSSDKIGYFRYELASVVVTLIRKKVLNENKLSKLLSLRVNLEEAMALQLTNHYSYIMELIREHSVSTARTFLNQMTDQINRVEDMVHRLIEDEVKRYRELDEQQDDEEEINFDQYTRRFDNSFEQRRTKDEDYYIGKTLGEFIPAKQNTKSFRWK